MIKHCFNSAPDEQGFFIEINVQPLRVQENYDGEPCNKII